jgi:signal transduction histidine kinase
MIGVLHDREDACMEASWKPLARQLWDHLQQSEAKFTLLQHIDSAILSPDITVDRILESVIHALVTLLNTPRVSIYLAAEDSVDLLMSTAVTQVRRLPRPTLVGAPGQPGEIHILTDKDAPFLAALPAQSTLVAPLFGATEELFAFLVVESDHPAELEHLEQIKDFASAASKQLSLAVEFKEDRRSGAVRWAILREILANDLKPTVGFEVVCRHLISFLPTLEGCAISPAPQRQILLHLQNDDFLTIVATSGHEALNTRVLVDRSVTGRLIKTGAEYLKTDPRTDPLYRPYLGAEMRSEVALRVPLTDKVTAVLNFESENDDAFREIHITSLRAAAVQMSPVLAGLHARHDRNLLQQRALLYALDKHLGDVTAAFAHDVSGPLSTARVIVDEIARTAASDATNTITSATAELLDRIATVDSLRAQLQTDIVGFSHNERRNVASLMRGAIQLIRPDELRKRNITIVENVDDSAEVYCSLFLKEVFSNLLMNAKYWVSQRQADAPGYEGRINIKITRERREDARGNSESNLNEKVCIVVRDNGPGMALQHLDKVFEQSFTLRKGGTGYGLFAAKEYVTSIDGEIRAASQSASYFEVTIVLDEYASRAHPDDSASIFVPDAPRSRPQPIDG